MLDSRVRPPLRLACHLRSQEGGSLERQHRDHRQPTVQGYTEKDRQVANIVGRRLADVYGLEPGDIVLHGFVLSMWIAGFPVADVMQNIGACVVPVGALSGAERFAEIARNVAAVQLNCTPSYAQYLIEKLPERADIRASDLGIKRLLLAGEPGGSIPRVRECLSKGFGGAQVFDWIGATGGSLMSSVSCEANDGLHFLAEDYILLELVEPETLEVGTSPLTRASGTRRVVLARHVRDPSQ